MTHYPQKATSKKLISTCRDIFSSYGVAEELSSDGGPQFTASEFKSFLKDWGVRHRISSAAYPQSNGRAELAVKAAKRIILDNTNADGSLDNDSAVKAILQHRNTPIPELGLSPAQLLLHRQLRDTIPTNSKRFELHKDWIVSAEEREIAFAKRNQRIIEEYDKHAHPLIPLQVQTAVRIQEHDNWRKTGTVVEVLPDRQYRIKMDGSGRLCLRNRRFLKPITPIPSPHVQTAAPSGPQDNTPQMNSKDNMANPTYGNTDIESDPKGSDDKTNTPTNQDNVIRLQPEDSNIIDTPSLPIQQTRSRTQKRSLRNLGDFNRRGFSESGSPKSRL